MGQMPDWLAIMSLNRSAVHVENQPLGGDSASSNASCRRSCSGATGSLLNSRRAYKGPAVGTEDWHAVRIQDDAIARDPASWWGCHGPFTCRGRLSRTLCLHRVRRARLCLLLRERHREPQVLALGALKLPFETSQSQARALGDSMIGLVAAALLLQLERKLIGKMHGVVHLPLIRLDRGGDLLFLGIGAQIAAILDRPQEAHRHRIFQLPDVATHHRPP